MRLYPYSRQTDKKNGASEKQQQVVGFRIGDEANGTAWTKLNPKWEYADYYRAGGLKRVNANNEPADESDAPPWLGAPPDMEVYEWRGYRVLLQKLLERQVFSMQVGDDG